MLLASSASQWGRQIHTVVMPVVIVSRPTLFVRQKIKSYSTLYCAQGLIGSPHLPAVPPAGWFSPVSYSMYIMYTLVVGKDTVYTVYIYKCGLLHRWLQVDMIFKKI
jgi:hypothetical protein